MKRKLTALLLVLLLAVTLAVPALAAGDWVTDEAGLLTDQQISQLSQRAAALAHSSGVGVYIRTVDDYADYGFTDVETASYTLYHNDSLGVGDGRDGVLLLLSVSRPRPRLRLRRQGRAPLPGLCPAAARGRLSRRLPQRRLVRGLLRLHRRLRRPAQRRVLYRQRL